MANSSPETSITNLTRNLYRFIVNHPLIINPPVYHPLTKQKVFIENYRLYQGLNINQGLTCSIFGYQGGEDSIPNPLATSVTARYDPHDIGHNIDHAVYHIVIALYYNELSINNKIEDSYYTEVDEEAITEPEQLLLTSNGRKTVNLEINPGIEIIGDYLELLRIVISDQDHRPYFPVLGAKSFEVVYSQINTGSWEKDKNIYFQSGCLMTRLDAYVSRGWRDKFFTDTIEDISVNIN